MATLDLECKRAADAFVSGLLAPATVDPTVGYGQYAELLAWAEAVREKLHAGFPKLRGAYDSGREWERFERKYVRQHDFFGHGSRMGNAVLQVEPDDRRRILRGFASQVTVHAAGIGFFGNPHPRLLPQIIQEVERCAAGGGLPSWAG